MPAAVSGWLTRSVYRKERCRVIRGHGFRLRSSGSPVLRGLLPRLFSRPCRLRRRLGPPVVLGRPQSLRGGLWRDRLGPPTAFRLALAGPAERDRSEWRGHPRRWARRRHRRRRDRAAPTDVPAGAAGLLADGETPRSPLPSRGSRIRSGDPRRGTRSVVRDCRPRDDDVPPAVVPVRVIARIVVDDHPEPGYRR